MLPEWCFQKDGYGRVTENKRKELEAKVSFC